jgi:effector-binding domain-containing protein
MKRVRLSWIVALAWLAVLGLTVTGNAAEIIYQDDITQNLVT